MRLERTIDISAFPETVWSATEDIERCSEWAPTMDEIVRLD